MDVIITLTVIGGGLILVFWVLNLLWRIGVVSFVSNRIIIPIITSIVIGAILTAITGEPAAGIGGGITVSIISFIISAHNN